MKKLTIVLIGSVLCLSQSQGFAQSVSVDYGVFYSHELLQTDSSTVVDYNTGDIPGNTVPGPYSFGAFDHLTPNSGGNSSTVTTPSTTYPLVFTTDDNAFNYHSPGYATQSAVEAVYANGTYSVAGSATPSVSASGPLSLDASVVYPNTPQILLVNGAAAQWLGGSLVLNVNQTNTITWSAFTTYSNTVGANISLNIWSTTGPGGNIVNVNAFTGPSGSGDAPFNGYTFNPGDLLSGQAYVGGISYTQLTDLTFASGNADVAGYETELNFTITTVPETNNFWLVGIALLAIGLRFFWRRQIGLIRGV